jgi:signal transduction histidine kinase
MSLLPAAVEVAAYRIDTEAVTNTLRHAQAKICTINLEVNKTISLEIRDDGNSLPVKYQPGVDLSSMRERAVELGGSFEISSNPGWETALAVQLPITIR